MPTHSIKQDIFNARRGDRQALDCLLDRLQERLLEMAHRELGPSLRAKIHTSDLLQSAFLDVVRYVETFEGETEEQFIGWFHRILNHNIRDKVRYFDAQKRRIGDQESVTRLADPMGRTPSTEVQLGDIEEGVSDEMKRALGNLTPEQRVVIELRFTKGMTHNEIADEVGRSPEAIRAMVWRARAALALDLERQNGDQKKK